MLNKQQIYPSCLIDTELQTRRIHLTRYKVSEHSKQKPEDQTCITAAELRNDQLLKRVPLSKTHQTQKTIDEGKISTY
ncbi:MAG: hypothetical protein CMJ77_22185 [Planctomycetaceae bacterium]|nr:hypothetical protein [Planctomycetaceae bacterium]